MKKAICVILIILILATASGVIQLFLIGEPVDGNTVITDVEVDGNVVYLHIMTLDSAMAFCGESRSREDSTLYITLRKVLVSPVHDSGYHIAAVNVDDITQIVLGGKTVWTKNEQTGLSEDSPVLTQKSRPPKRPGKSQQITC